MAEIKDRMAVYNAVRGVPDSAKRTIKAGRLRGFTDVNPMWRIKTLTEQFGPCGIGWKVETLERWADETSTGEVVANVRLGLRVKVGGEWSDPIEGCGGSMLVASEKAGLRASDEAWKMATTDALSVCCKLLGMAADVYWEADRTKYSPVCEPPRRKGGVVGVSDVEIKTFQQLCQTLGQDYKKIMVRTGWTPSDDWTPEYHGRAMIILKDIENAQSA